MAAIEDVGVRYAGQLRIGESRRERSCRQIAMQVTVMADDAEFANLDRRDIVEMEAGAHMVLVFEDEVDHGVATVCRRIGLARAGADDPRWPEQMQRKVDLMRAGIQGDTIV